VLPGVPQLRGHWTNRLPMIDKDIALIEAKLASAKPGSDAKVGFAIAALQARPVRKQVEANHVPQRLFKPGEPLVIDLSVHKATNVKLHYRHVNQAERYTVVEMGEEAGSYKSEIPAAYTVEEYPLQYFFEITQLGGTVDLYPGFSNLHMNPPYFVVPRS
jgi:hypothetical protein